MKARVFFLLLPLALLSACIMETPRIPQEGLGRGTYPFITESFDFVTSDFNWATFNAQRSAWQGRAYKNYGYDLSLGDGDTSEDRESAFKYYRCEVMVENGEDPELTWIEGVLPEDRPSVYTMDGIYDYVFSLMENLDRRAKEGNGEFRGYIQYYPLYNIPCLVLIDRLENGVWEGFRTMDIAFWGTKKTTEEELPAVMHAFDRGTFEQEYNAWKELGIKNYRYFLHIFDSRLNGAGSAPAWTLITVQDGKEPKWQTSPGEHPYPLEDYTIDGVFDFIASALEDPSSSGLEFHVAYSPHYHIPIAIAASVPLADFTDFTPEALVLKMYISLSHFAVLLPSS
jgi:hypothetical protein